MVDLFVYLIIHHVKSFSDVSPDLKDKVHAALAKKDYNDDGVRVTTT